MVAADASDSKAAGPVAARGKLAVPAGRWTVDRERSKVGFAIRHLMVATVHGAFERFDASLETCRSGLVRASGIVEAGSIETGERKRDEVLLGPGFLDAGRYPGIGFSARRAAQDDAGVLEVLGDLTLKGVTRPVRLAGTIAGVRSESGEIGRARILARGAISRTQFGVTGEGVLESAGAVVSDTVRIVLDLSAVRLGEDRW